MEPQARWARVPIYSADTSTSGQSVIWRQRRLGRHMHTTVTAVWRYINADYQALCKAEQRPRRGEADPTSNELAEVMAEHQFRADDPRDRAAGIVADGECIPDDHSQNRLQGLE